MAKNVNRWDNRRLWDRIAAEARFKQIDLSEYVTIPEAAAIMHCSKSTVMYRFDWLCGITLCGRKLVKRNRTEWLQRFRDGQLTSDDQMGESLAPFDVNAARKERDREKVQQVEARRRKAEEERPKGFHVDGKIWWDYDNNDTWVPLGQAKINLGISRPAIHSLADRGVIRRRWAHRTTRQPIDPPRQESASNTEQQVNPKRPIGPMGPRTPMRGCAAMFSLRDIEAYIERRDNRGRKRPVSFNDPDRPFTPVRVYYPEESLHENCLLPLWKVAQILGISRQRVTGIVTSGKLKAYQRIPGRQGVPVWFSATQVKEYADSEERLKFRRAYEERQKRIEAGDYTKTEKKPYQFEFGQPYVYRGIRNLKKDHGEYYTIRQAAEILGCSSSSVKYKIKKKILPATRANHPERKWNDRRWWFIKKEDLHSYKASREYRKRRKAFVEGRHRKLFGLDVEENLAQWVKTIERGPVTPGEDRYIPNDPRNAVFLKTEQQRWREESYAYLQELKDMESDPRINGYYPGHYFNEGHRRFDP